MAGEHGKIGPHIHVPGSGEHGIPVEPGVNPGGSISKSTAVWIGVGIVAGVGILILLSPATGGGNWYPLLGLGL